MPPDATDTQDYLSILADAFSLGNAVPTERYNLAHRAGYLSRMAHHLSSSSLIPELTESERKLLYFINKAGTGIEILQEVIDIYNGQWLITFRAGRKKMLFDLPIDHQVDDNELALVADNNRPFKIVADDIIISYEMPSAITDLLEEDGFEARDYARQKRHHVICGENSPYASHPIKNELKQLFESPLLKIELLSLTGDVDNVIKMSAAHNIALSDDVCRRLVVKAVNDLDVACLEQITSALGVDRSVISLFDAIDLYGLLHPLTFVGHTEEAVGIISVLLRGASEAETIVLQTVIPETLMSDEVEAMIKRQMVNDNPVSTRRTIRI